MSTHTEKGQCIKCGGETIKVEDNGVYSCDLTYCLNIGCGYFDTKQFNPDHPDYGLKTGYLEGMEFREMIHAWGSEEDLRDKLSGDWENDLEEVE